MSDVATITVRLGDDAEAALRRTAAERGLPSVSAAVRQAIDAWMNPGAVTQDLDQREHLDGLERRVSRLEEMAGL